MYTISINFSGYFMSCPVEHDKLQSMLEKLCKHVLRLSDDELSFFNVPNAIEEIFSLYVDESCSLSVSPLRPFYLTVRRSA